MHLSAVSLAIASLALTPPVPTTPATAPTAPATAEPASKPATTPAAKAEEIGFGAVRTPTLVTRVGGDTKATIEVTEGVYRCGPCGIESPLPDGYPEPTPPGAIDIKTYPSVRRAEFRQESARGLNARMNGGFWPLFNHIKSHDIPMTSPVEIEYDGVYNDLSTLKPTADGAWTMSFLYRVKNLGPVGQDGAVKVVDSAEVTVLSTAVRGPYGMNVTRDGVKILKEWLDGQTEWAIAGTPRVFHYNGPSVRDGDKWSEVQIPVKKTEAPAAPGSAQSAPAPSR
jgi:hypothetical protein